MFRQSSKKRFFKDACNRKFHMTGSIILCICITLIASISYSTVAAPSDEITVSAAASLTNSFREIAADFEVNKKNVKVHLNFASSGDLMRQIEGGAPVDVFASAAAREMDELEKKKLIVAGTRCNFAENGIVLIKQTSSRNALKTFSDLKNPDIKKIAIGNPASVAAGMYAEQALRYLKIWDNIKDKLIYGEHVRQVLDYVARGEVDAGIVFSTDASVRAKDVTVVMAAPESSYNKALYPIAVVRDAKNEALSRLFVDFVLSPEGKKILEKYGFKSMK
ncbi:MAG: molybdate ABC transporter substrate-binding protein [Proteobacteria bacterium]|nr:molybdate ABC transporter substrate-binding protein [Pseudomonadota bacterium]